MRKSCGLVLASLRDTKEPLEDLDELGFRSFQLRSQFIPHDDAKDIQRWEGFLEFTIGKSWPSFRGVLSDSQHLSQLLGEGVPVSLRPQLYALIGNIYAQIDKTGTQAQGCL